MIGPPDNVTNRIKYASTKNCAIWLLKYSLFKHTAILIKNTIIIGKYVDYNTGKILNNENNCVSDYIIVTGLSHIISNIKSLL